MHVKVSVVIPVYNEERHISEVVKGAKKYGQVIVVDDGSGDETAELARESGAKVLKLTKNKGKGYAMRIGAERALNDGADVIVFMDGDGQHRPEDIPKFLDRLGEADAVFGSRWGGNMPLIKRVGNWGISIIYKALFGHKPSDLLCGFRAFKSDALKKVWWDSNGYLIEIETSVKSEIEGLKIAHVEIPTIYYNARKGTGVIDGLRLGAMMFRMRIRAFLNK